MREVGQREGMCLPRAYSRELWLRQKGQEVFPAEAKNEGRSKDE